jgi:hypothetical protein
MIVTRFVSFMQGRLSPVTMAGGLGALFVLCAAGCADTSRNDQQESVPVSTLAPVDHGGWMLTAEDASKLVATSKIKQLDHTNLAGGDIGSRVVADVSACALWCLLEPDCRSFAFAKPGPAISRPNTCWIKSSVPAATPSEFHTSGIVE